MKDIGHKSQGMVDVSAKDLTKRVARATATIKMKKATFAVMLKKGSPKGNIFETAKVAGIMAAKSTPAIIPLCHPLALSKASVVFEPNKSKFSLIVTSEISCIGPTGVEMEALTAVTVAALTIYDMMKWSDKEMEISDIKLLYKSGGKSGKFERKR